ncbi:hypothetical protein [Rhizobium terrae]|uniref:hypothetical protein n=1 Tax=Rhizobium terrae TaxID=2171756 RepID=UPI000E3CFE76|nr:hypothetical protein [Rhizobium terrae]
MSDDHIPSGWSALVADLRSTLRRDYPDVRVNALTADRGWLHVDVDQTSIDPGTAYQLGRRIQGFVTQSLSTCGCCGSAHARDRGNGRIVTCDECEEASYDA